MTQTALSTIFASTSVQVGFDYEVRLRSTRKIVGMSPTVIKATPDSPKAIAPITFYRFEDDYHTIVVRGGTAMLGRFRKGQLIGITVMAVVECESPIVVEAAPEFAPDDPFRSSPDDES